MGRVRVRVRVRQDKTKHELTRQDKTKQGKPRQDKTRQDKTRQDKTRQDKTRKRQEKGLSTQAFLSTHQQEVDKAVSLPVEPLLSDLFLSYVFPAL